MDDLVTWLKAQLEICVAEADEIHNRDCDSTSDCCYLPGPCDCGIPARVLREVEAKRRILDGPLTGSGPDQYTEWEWTLKVLALPFLDRPGYREEWRP